MNPQRSRPSQGHFRRHVVLTGVACLGLTVTCVFTLHALSPVHAAEAQEQAKAPASEPAAEETLSPKPDRKHAAPAGEQPPTREEPLWPILKDLYPERFNQLKALREKDPHKFAQVEREMRPWLHQLREAKAQNPELAQLMAQQPRIEMEMRNWQSRYNAAGDEQRKVLLDEGRKLAETRVNLRLQQDRLRIQALEKRLHDLKAGLSERETHKNKIIERELSGLTSPRPHPATRPAP